MSWCEKQGTVSKRLKVPSSDFWKLIYSFIYFNLFIYAWSLPDSPSYGHTGMLHYIHLVLLHYYPCWFGSLRCDCFLRSQTVKNFPSSQSAASSFQPAAGCKANKERETNQRSETKNSKMSLTWAVRVGDTTPVNDHQLESPDSSANRLPFPRFNSCS